jgi:alkylation response protein AidB-like acyl-CoA dehydrogenase
MTANAFAHEPHHGLAEAFWRFCEGAVSLPHPGSGRTIERWRVLAQMAAQDLSLVKLAEAHADALSILAECGAPKPDTGTRWAVWAANPPNARLSARRLAHTLRLNGTKAWCSGASLVTHALVTCFEGETPLLARVDMHEHGTTTLPATWANAGMRDAQTTSVTFKSVEAKLIGSPGCYVERPGFWQGAIGIAACWHGAATAIALPLLNACARRNDAHAFAHLGFVQAALSASASVLRGAASWVDEHPMADAQRIALTTRAVVENAATETIQRVGRALGAGPLCQDARHAQRVSDLSVFMRQSHAEHDLEALGRLAENEALSWQLS